MKSLESEKLFAKYDKEIAELKTAVESLQNNFISCDKKLAELEYQYNVLIEKINDVQKTILDTMNNQMTYNNQMDTKVNDSSDLLNENIIKINVELSRIQTDFLDLKTRLKGEMDKITKEYSSINRSMRNISPENYSPWTTRLFKTIAKIFVFIWKDKALKTIFLIFIIALLIWIFGADKVKLIIDILKGSNLGG